MCECTEEVEALDRLVTAIRSCSSLASDPACDPAFSAARTALRAARKELEEAMAEADRIVLAFKKREEDERAAYLKMFPPEENGS